MAKNDVLQLAKELKITDQRELFTKVVVSFSTMSKALNVAFGNTQGAGTDGFLGVYQDELVCFDANLMGTKPNKERFRISIEFIRSHAIKKGFLGIKLEFIVKTDHDHFKFYVSKKQLSILEEIARLLPQT